MQVLGVNNNSYQKSKVEKTKASNPNKALPDYNKTCINGEIEHFQQAKNGCDCQILSDLISLKYTTWGKNFLKENVKSDGMGGAIVTLNGAKNNKNIAVSIEELLKAKSDPLFAKGDDDVIALELAVVKYIKREGGEIPDNIVHGRIFSRNNIEGNIITLLCGDNYVEKYYNTHEYDDSSPTQLKKLLSLSKDCAKQISFKPEFDHREFNGYFIKAYHAYTLKSFSKDKVVIIDPFDTKKEIKFSFEDFYDLVDSVHITGNKELLAKKEFKPYYKKQFERNEFLYAKERIVSRWGNYENMASIILENAGDAENYLNNLSSKEKYMLTKHYANQVITRLDGFSTKSKNKHKFIDPLIDAVIEQAKFFEIDEQEITNFRETCNKEMDAFFYTDEKEIIKAFNKINKLIEVKMDDYFEGVL